VTPPFRSRHFYRLLEVLRPGGIVIMIIEGYFDESGALDEPPGIFCISGYFIAPDAARAMHADWLAMLENYQLAFFHMVDCAHGNEGFEHLNKQERAEVVIAAIALIKKYTLEGYSFLRTERHTSRPARARPTYIRIVRLAASKRLSCFWKKCDSQGA
jgi:hypothetical protein